MARLLYCAVCDWKFEGDAEGVGTVNECGGCGQHGLSFMRGAKWLIAAELRSRGRTVPDWLEASSDPQVS